VVIELIGECAADIFGAEQAERDARITESNVFGLLKLKDAFRFVRA
jgi:hypothetical protein